MTENQYLGDKPLEDEENDLFSRWPFSMRIADSLSRRNDTSCLVLGIYGAWGEGKTTVINYIKAGLKDIDDVITVTFNPWIFPNENELLLSFFKTISDSLGRTITKRSEEIGEAITKYAWLLAPAYGGASDAAKGLGNVMSNVDIEDYKKRIENILNEEDKRLVIFVDDIDRLDKKEIQAIFRLIKLSADFNNTSYVLAFDEEMVAAALREQYSSSDKDAGRNFLEKIVQVPLNLPPAPKSSLEGICFSGIDEVICTTSIELEEKQVHEFWGAFYRGISARLSTPRMAKRYVNAIQFSLPITLGEVNPIDLMLIEGVRIFYPNLYQHIRNNKDVYLSNTRDRYGMGGSKQQEEYARLREDGLSDLSESDKSSAREIISYLFPRTGNTIYGGDWDISWVREQKIASSEYFDRYFSYTIPPSDVSDRSVTSFINDLDTIEPEEALVRFIEILKGKEERLIRKLRANEEHYSEVQSIKMASILAMSGNSLPNPEKLSFYTTPYVQAAILISHLLKNINKKDRYEVAKQVVDNGIPIHFSNECLRWMHTGKETSELDRLFSEEDEGKLRKSFASRVAKEAKKGPIYKAYPKHSQSLLNAWKWGASKDDTSSYLNDIFFSSNEEAVTFLLTYVPTAWSMDTGIPHKSDFSREHYNSIEAILDPEILQSALIQYLGEKIEVNEYPRLFDADKNMEKTIIKQFLYIHKFAMEELENTNSEYTENEPEA